MGYWMRSREGNYKFFLRNVATCPTEPDPRQEPTPNEGRENFGPREPPNPDQPPPSYPVQEPTPNEGRENFGPSDGAVRPSLGHTPPDPFPVDGE